MKRANRKTVIRALVCALVVTTLILPLVSCSSSLPASSQREGADAQAEHSGINGSLRSTVLYYLADTGHIIPIMKSIPWEEGIGKAALSYLVATDENAAAASMKGLKAIIPEGVSFELTIDAEKNATLNIIGLPEMENADVEKAMLVTVVNTLVEFPSIDSVSLLLDGKKVSKLPLGTPVQDRMTGIPLNVRNGDAAAMADGANEFMTVYFPNSTCSLQIPITVFTEEKATFQDAVNLMLSEAGADIGLKNCFPGGTVCLSAVITDGIAVVNFSAGLAEIAGDSEGTAEALYNSLYLTAIGFADVSELRLYADGEYFPPGSASVSAPRYPNMF